MARRPFRFEQFVTVAPSLMCVWFAWKRESESLTSAKVEANENDDDDDKLTAKRLFVCSFTCYHFASRLVSDSSSRPLSHLFDLQTAICNLQSSTSSIEIPSARLGSISTKLLLVRSFKAIWRPRRPPAKQNSLIVFYLRAWAFAVLARRSGVPVIYAA